MQNRQRTVNPRSLFWALRYLIAAFVSLVGTGRSNSLLFSWSSANLGNASGWTPLQTITKWKSLPKWCCLFLKSHAVFPIMVMSFLLFLAFEQFLTNKCLDIYTLSIICDIQGKNNQPHLYSAFSMHILGRTLCLGHLDNWTVFAAQQIQVKDWEQKLHNFCWYEKGLWHGELTWIFNWWKTLHFLMQKWRNSQLFWWLHKNKNTFCMTK